MTTSRRKKRGPAEAEAIEVGGARVAPGTRVQLELPAARLPTHTEMHIPVTVVHGKKPGPRLWVSAAVHGDELNGVEVIRRLLERLVDPLRSGTLIAAPIVNVFGFIGQSRYLPDRRDLNRMFPGSKRGSLASRLAHIFMTEIVRHATHGIDLHTASLEKSNHPQIRADLSDPETRRCAVAFAAPLMIDSPARSGSLRSAASKLGRPVLVYEAGEAQRFNPEAIRIGVEGVLSVMAELGMISRRFRVRRRRSMQVDETRWVRARAGGLLRLYVTEGQLVPAGFVLAMVADAFGDGPTYLQAPFEGIVIGVAQNPVVHAGDGVVHVGRIVPSAVPSNDRTTPL